MSGTQTLLQRADIAVFAADYSLQLIIEIKTKINATPDWGMQYRRNLLVHQSLPKSPFFMFVMPDQIFLWTNASLEVERYPDYQLKTTVVFGQSVVTDLQDISHDALELITRSWLHLLTIADLRTEALEPHQQWLLESGLYSAIFSGSVGIESRS
jgi:hypothetical protein